MKENEIVKFKQQCDCDDVQDVEFEIVSYADDNPYREELEYIDSRLDKRFQEIDKLSKEIDRLTNKADGLDYAVAASSGILCGLIDSFFVGISDFGQLKGEAHKIVNKFIEKFANVHGYEGDKEKGGNRLQGAIDFLEGEFKVDNDNPSNVSSPRLHHLEDIAHHPTLLGMVASIVVAFLRCAIFVDKNGEWHIKIVATDLKKMASVWGPIVASGILNWLLYFADKKRLEKVGTGVPQPIKNILSVLASAPAVVEVLKVIINWFGHLVSDMGGSYSSASKGNDGMGIPGISISLLKELSSLPILKDTGLPQFVSDLYSKGHWDLRKELALGMYLGKQSIPIIANEVIVRLFYFIRRLILEYNSSGSWKTVNWSNVLPFNNRTIARMLTISSGTFVAVDMADAAIRASLSTDPASFGVQFLLRVNFVGVGRFVVALGTDIAMGIQRRARRMERINCYNEVIHLYNAKVFYLEGNMWKQLEATNESLTQLDNAINNSMKALVGTIGRIDADVESIKDVIKRNKELQDFVDNLI